MTQVEACQYELLDGDIHRFALSPSKTAVDQFFAILDAVIQEHPQQEIFKMMMVLKRADDLPANYFARQATTYWKEHRNTPPIRAAYVHDAKFILALFEQFVKTLRLKSQRQLFSLHEHDAAIQWLLSE